MSQTVVNSFFASQKRFKEPTKNVKIVENDKISKSFLEEETTSTVKKETKSTVKKETKSTVKSSVSNKSRTVKASTKTKSKHVNKLTNYLKSDPVKKKLTEKDVQADEKSTDTLTTDVLPDNKPEPPRTPKRNLSTPEESTPTKKKVLQEESVSPVSTSKPLLNVTFTTSPEKSEVNTRRKLVLSSSSSKRIASPRKFSSPVKNSISPQKAASYGNMKDKELSSILNDSRSKILFSNRLDELKVSLEKFSKLSSKVKDYQSNCCKITSVVASAKTRDTQQKPAFQGEPAFKKYSYLASPDSLVLPYKYKVLGETFRCTDTVISMLNNRKEKITFEKLQSGVQKMIKKNFQKSHLGQMLTVFPAAFSLQYEKNDSYTKDKSSSCYDLVITPNLQDMNGNSIKTGKPSGKQQKELSSTFIHMTPQLLIERKNTFFESLTKMAMLQHKEFLKRLDFPAVDDNAIIRWHPKFNVDGVPDIPVASLPEEPESKIHTAKDVLSKIKGSVRGRVEKALQSVVDEHNTKTNLKSSPSSESINNSINKKQSSALKGICTDLLEKIRARESAKLVETMTRSVEDEKRKAMMERLPKIVHIIWHYFIAERKFAVSVEAAVDKIIHSFNSLATPEAVKEHLQLITEVMPGWLTFIKITKGEYITMNKSKDINEMLAYLK